jgi:polygalacturonase
LNNVPSRAVHLAYADYAIARNLRIDGRHAGSEGIRVESGTYVLIENGRFRTPGNPLSITSVRDHDGQQARQPSAYIVVRNNDLGGGNGILLGGRMSGGIRSIFFTDNILRAGRYAMRFDGDLDRGGAVEHIRVRNMTVESSVQHLFRFELKLDPASEYQGHPPAYRDFVFENITAGHAETLFEAHAPRQVPLQNVLLKNVVVGRADRDFVLENVEDLHLENTRIGAQTVNGGLDWKEQSAEERQARR